MSRMATAEQPLTIVSLTESAATKIRDLMAEEPAGEAAVLRIAVQGGGCSGFQYALGFDRGPQDGDHELDSYGVPVVVDPFSAPYLTGTEIDWVEGLQAASRSTTRTSPARAAVATPSRWKRATPPAAGCGSGCRTRLTAP
jgi:iron-sulfur cluster insertion protein